MDVTFIAKVAHQVNKAYCDAIGDHSQPIWASAPKWQKDSAIAGVKHHIEHPDTTPQGSHDLWLDVKIKDGWKYGPVKDADKKEHPCMVPYDDLPLEQKVKDYLFREVVRQLK